MDASQVHAHCHLLQVITGSRQETNCWSPSLSQGDTSAPFPFSAVEMKLFPDRASREESSFNLPRSRLWQAPCICILHVADKFIQCLLQYLLINSSWWCEAADWHVWSPRICKLGIDDKAATYRVPVVQLIQGSSYRRSLKWSGSEGQGSETSAHC